VLYIRYCAAASESKTASLFLPSKIGTNGLTLERCLGRQDDRQILHADQINVTCENLVFCLDMANNATVSYAAKYAPIA
jgi:hypothetical protein